MNDPKPTGAPGQAARLGAVALVAGVLTGGSLLSDLLQARDGPLSALPPQGKARAQSLAENVLRHLNGRAAPKNIHWELIKVVMGSAANTAIIPMQDVLGLGEEARINRPSTTYHNWQWRMNFDDLKENVVRKLVKITKASKRD